MKRTDRARRARAGAAQDHYIRGLSYALWSYSLGLAEAGVVELQCKPSAAETDASQTYDCVHIPLDITRTITPERAIHYQPREKPRACHPGGD